MEDLDTIKEENEIIKIIIADDHKLIIEGISRYISSEPNLEVIGDCSNGEELLEKLKTEASNVDLIILDISMPKLNGIQATKVIKEKYPHIKVLVLSGFCERDIVYDVIDADADGFILKHSDKSQIIDAINKIYENGTYYDSSIIEILKSYRIEQEESEQQILLTDREMQILKLICLEHSTNEIAKKLFITKHAVNWHRKNIIKKTGAKNVISLMKYAFDNKLIS